MWYKGKEYYSVNKWVGIFNRDYKDKGIKVNAHDIHQLFGYYKIPKLKINGNGEIVENGRRVLYPVNLVNQVRTMKEDFMYVLSNIIEYGVSNGKEFYIPYNEKEITEPTYKNDENDMEKYSNNLEKQYQFENKKVIKLTELQYKRLFEGATYTNNNGKIDFSIDSKQSDLDNKNIDTRVFGTKNNILYGDSTLSNRFKTFNDSYIDNISLIKFYRNLIDYVNNDFNGILDFSVLRNDVALKIQNLIKKRR